MTVVGRPAQVLFDGMIMRELSRCSRCWTRKIDSIDLELTDLLLAFGNRRSGQSQRAPIRRRNQFVHPPRHMRQLSRARCDVRGILFFLKRLRGSAAMPRQSICQIKAEDYIRTLRLSVLVGIFPFFLVSILLP